MPEAVCCRRKELEPAEPLIDARRPEVPEDPRVTTSMISAERIPISGERTMNTSVFVHPAAITTPSPPSRSPRPRIRRRAHETSWSGRPTYQVIRSQTIAPSRPAKITADVTTLMIDHARNRSSSPPPCRSRSREEIEERGPHDRLSGRQHARRDDRGDRVRRVVKAVDVVEDKGDGDQRHTASSVGSIASRA